MSIFQTFNGFRARGATYIPAVVTALGQRLAPLVRIRRPLPALEPYGRSWSLRRIASSSGYLLLLGLFCIIYGFFFALTAPYWTVLFTVPIVVIGLMVVWALPDFHRPPTLGIEFLLPSLLIAMVLWPNYVAVALPGLPWITVSRLFSFPLVALLLVCISVSSEFRSVLFKAVTTIKPLWVCLCGFAIVQFYTLFLSEHPPTSLMSVLLFQVTCTGLFAVGAILFTDIRQVEKYFALLCALSLPLLPLAFIEAGRQHVLWASHIPSFLKISDPAVARMLAPSIRQYIDMYRVHVTFTGPLTYAEYLSLLTPLLLYFATTRRNLFVRVGAVALVPLDFVVIRLTDSRLGVVGMLVSVLLYGLFWSVVRWRSRPRDLMAAAMVYAYPALFGVAVGLILASHTLSAMVFGEGAQASSTEARQAQLAMALPQVWHNPLGYGAAQCGLKMGFAPGDFITIDNYFISLVLDHGVLGVVFWYGMFISGIAYALRYCFSATTARTPEARLLTPISIVLIGFLIIKWVHAATDNHPIYFLMLGMLAALVYRIRNPAEQKT